MALVLMEGFETLPVIKNYMTSSGFTPTASTGRDGIGKALTGVTGSATVPLLTPVSTIIVGFGFWTSSVVDFIDILGDGGATNHLTLSFDTTMHMQLLRGSTVLATSTFMLEEGRWHYIEMKATIADAGGIAIVRVNGVTWINYTGDTKNAGTLSTIAAVKLHTVTTGSIFFDDLYILDDTGSAPYNDFLGERVIRPVRPSAAGASTGLTPSAGANWQCVDDNPWATTAGDYVSTTTTGTDTYTCSDISGLVSVDAVQVFAQGIKTDTGVKFLRLLAYNGTTNESPDRPFSTTLGWHQSDILKVDPSGAVWTQASVNSAEFGVKVI